MKFDNQDIPSLEERMKFGKWRGAKLIDICEQDPDYARWMVKNEIVSEELCELIIDEIGEE